MWYDFGVLVTTNTMIQSEFNFDNLFIINWFGNTDGDRELHPAQLAEKGENSGPYIVQYFP